MKKISSASICGDNVCIRGLHTEVLVTNIAALGMSETKPYCSLRVMALWVVTNYREIG